MTVVAAGADVDGRGGDGGGDGVGERGCVGERCVGCVASSDVVGFWSSS